VIAGLIGCELRERSIASLFAFRGCGGVGGACGRLAEHARNVFLGFGSAVVALPQSERQAILVACMV
jgi:hypothetical protein